MPFPDDGDSESDPTIDLSDAAAFDALGRSYRLERLETGLSIPGSVGDSIFPITTTGGRSR